MMKRILTSALILTAAASFAAIPGPATLVAGGPGDQTDPHISASTIAYTDNASGQSRIHYTDTALLVSGSVPAASTETDLLSDVSGNTIVFTRTLLDGTSNIYRYTTGELVATAITNDPAGAYTNASVGGAYVAFEDGNTGNVIAAPLSGVLPTTLGMGVSPAVSADGTAIAYLANCTQTSCDVKVATAPFSAATQIDTGANNDGPNTGVDTNGSKIVFISGGDLAWVSVTGGVVSTYPLAGADQNPNISGNLVAFEHSDGTQTDIYVKDISTGAAAVNITNTPGVNETLNDIFVTGTRVEVVFARPSVTPGNRFDVYMTSFDQGATTCTPPVNNNGSGGHDDDDGDDDGHDDGDDDQDDDDDDDDGDDDDDDNNGQPGCSPATAVDVGSEGGSASTPPSEDPGQDNGDNAGCSATGAANAMWLVGLLGLFMMFRPTRAAARARRSRD